MSLLGRSLRLTISDDTRQARDEAMETSHRIRTAFERAATALAKRPAIGRGTAVAKVRLVSGLACEIEDGRWKLRVDSSEKTGGDGSAPDPGVLGRGALGSCLVISYAKWAAKLGVPISGIAVEVRADYDASGEYGVSDAPVGYVEVRYIVTIESDAPEHEIVELLDLADAHTPWLDVFVRAQQVRREVRVIAQGG